MVLPPGETSCWESGAAKSASREREGEAGPTRREFPRPQSLQRWLFLLCVTWRCTLQEEKERKEQEEQRKKLDEDAKKKKVLSNMTQQYGAAQKVRTCRIPITCKQTQVWMQHLASHAAQPEIMWLRS